MMITSGRNRWPRSLSTGPSCGRSARGRPCMPGALGLEVHRHEHREEVEHRRDQRRGRDVQVGDAEELRHHEGGGAHDRRHDLAAGRRHRLDRAGERRPIADLAHQGDREGAGGHHVGDRAAGDGAEQPAGDAGDLGRPADLVAGQRQREVHEQLAGAGALDQRAEDDEQDHVGCRDAGRDAEMPSVVR